MGNGHARTDFGESFKTDIPAVFYDVSAGILKGRISIKIYLWYVPIVTVFLKVIHMADKKLFFKGWI